MKDEKFIIKIFLAGLSAIIVLIIVFGSFYIVHAGERAVLLTFGDPDLDAKSEGLHFKLPLAQKAVKMDIKTQKYEAKASSASKDLQIVSADVAVNYHLSGDNIPILYRDIGVGYQDKIIQPAVQEVVKAVTAQYTAEELITKRAEVKDKIDTDLRNRLEKNYIFVETISITNFDFSQSFNAAIEAKVTAEQNALAAKNKLEQIKYEAEQRVTQATAEAEAIRIQASAIQSQGGRDYVQLQAISKWNGQMPQFVGGGAIPFINIPSSNINNQGATN